MELFKLVHFWFTRICCVTRTCLTSFAVLASISQAEEGISWFGQPPPSHHVIYFFNSSIQFLHNGGFKRPFESSK